LFGFHLNTFQIILCLERVLRRRYFGFDRRVELRRKTEIGDADRVDIVV